MIEFILKELWVEIFRILVISLGTLGIVYLAGRLLGIVRTDQSKNILAGVSLFFLSMCVSLVKFPRDRLLDTLWDISIYAIISVVPYTVLWWRLFDRTDSYLDSKGLKDKHKYSKIRKKRRRK